jgi:hypothetical protein
MTRWCCIRREDDCAVTEEICKVCPRWEPRVEDEEPESVDR